jgi:hypothetical protein
MAFGRNRGARVFLWAVFACERTIPGAILSASAQFADALAAEFLGAGVWITYDSVPARNRPRTLKQRATPQSSRRDPYSPPKTNHAFAGYNTQEPHGAVELWPAVR